jgi:hypothetical protein
VTVGRGRAAVVLAALGGLATLPACGSAPDLTNLRCDGACQDVQDPFLLKLAVDFVDPAKELAQGSVVVKIAGRTVATLTADPLMSPKGAGQGTLRFPLSLHFGTVHDGDSFTVGVAGSGTFGTTNELEETFQIHF